MATKIKKRLSFTFFKKHKKIAIFLICIAIFVSSFAFINYSRYVKNVVKVYYLRTKNFYFNSSLLVPDGKNKKTYTTQPWVLGNDRNFAISIEMNSRLNSLKVTEGEIKYTATCSTNNANVKCNIKLPDNGRSSTVDLTIPGSDDAVSPNTNTFVVEVVPDSDAGLENGDEVIVEVTAKSTDPYVLELSANFKLIVGDYAISYDILDKKNQRYFDVVITNSIPTQDYMVTLDISENLDKVALDQSTHIIDVIKGYADYDPNVSPGKYDPDYIGIASDGTIRTIKFLVQENSGALVRFYKKDPSQDYSYDSGLFKGTTSNPDTKPVVKADFICNNCSTP